MCNTMCWSQLFLISFAVISTKHRCIQTHSVKDTFQGNVAHLRAVVCHRYPHDVIHIARAIVVK